MYTREEASAIRESFWKTFGQYMGLQLSAEGMRINWINYKTGIRHLSFRMQADNRSACICIEMAHPDAGMQELMMEQFRMLKTLLEGYLEEPWDWQLHTTGDYGKTVSRIITCIEEVSIFRQGDWPQLISFFKPRIIALDAFWSDAQYSFDLFK